MMLFFYVVIFVIAGSFAVAGQAAENPLTDSEKGCIGLLGMRTKHGTKYGRELLTQDEVEPARGSCPDMRKSIQKKANGGGDGQEAVVCFMAMLHGYNKDHHHDPEDPLDPMTGRRIAVLCVMMMRDIPASRANAAVEYMIRKKDLPQ